ncbi:Pleckstrin homology domain-containing family G member 1, partial [Geodia barretti]
MGHSAYADRRTLQAVHPSFWDLYEEYGVNYPRAIRLLKEKCRDDGFNRFLAMKRGAARHTLESLMLLPVQRIYEYHRLLVQLFTITSKDHPDYDDLRHTVARVQHVV